MINKYPGTCGCGARVSAGDGEAYKVDGRWTVHCGDCAATPPTEPANPRRSNRLPTPQLNHNSSIRTNADFEKFLDNSDAPVKALHANEAVGAATLAPAALRAPAAATDGTYTLLSGHPASAYQAAVFDHFRYGRGSVIVNATAGSGKTTTMKNALRYLPERAHVQLFAFNTEAAGQLKDAIVELEALGERSYRNVRAGTFHSVGYAAILRHLDLGRDLKPDPGKCRKLLRAMLGESDEGQAAFRLYGAFATQLVGLAKGEGIGALVPDLPEAWWRLVDHHDLYLDSQDANPTTGVEIAQRLLVQSNGAAREGQLDYDDMLYLVCLWKLRLWRNDVVVCDESQDTNPVRRAMLHLALKDGGKLYSVGDRKQSIYGFTGASTDAIDLIQREFNARELPLTVSYRCARAVVERAQTWVPYIEPAPDAPEGEVLDEVPLAKALAMLGPDDAILCRQTAPLVTVAYGLIARGRACRIMGREIGEGLVNLIEQQKARGVDRLVEKLGIFRIREMAKLIAKGEEVRAEAVGDRVDCILVIVDALPERERTIPALVAKIRLMFVDDAKGERQAVLTLSTAHRAKGREWNKVAILRPELMPSRAARQDWMIAQEENLQYVAATRAKNMLIYIADEDMQIERTK